MRFTRKILIISIVSLIVITLLANWGVNVWVNKKVPELLSEKNKTPYYFTYKNIRVSIWSGNIKASEITVSPKNAVKDSLKSGIYAKIQSIEINNFSIWGILFNNKIKAKNIAVNKPEMVLYQKDEKNIDNSGNLRSGVVEPFQQIVIVSDMNVKNGDVKILLSKNEKTILSAANINVELRGILITDAILKRKIPFSFEKYAFSCDSIYYKNNPNYYIKASQIQTENTGLSLKDFAMVPDVGRSQFVKKLQKEKDLYDLKAKSVEIKNMNAGYKDERIFFNAGKIIFDKATANIYRSKMPDDDLTKKHLYNKLLRDLKFPMKVDTLLIKNSLLVYEEEINFEKGPGVITFNSFNMAATNIQSGFGQKRMDDLKIKIICKFMNTSPMKIDWKLNVLDKSDAFNIRGSIMKFDTKKLVSFSKPYSNIKQEGIFDEVYFNINGNDIRSKGDFALRYHDLKVTIYKKKDPEKKAKLKSAIANLLVKNDSGDELKETEIEVKRIQEKSFYNFFWRNIMEGLKKILI